MKTFERLAIATVSTGASLSAVLLLLVISPACAGVSAQEARAFDVYPKTVRFTSSAPGGHAVEAVVLRNRARQPLSFETMVEPQSTAFDASFSTCTWPLPGGEECAVFVTFSPVEAGDYRQRFCVRAQATEFCVWLTGVARNSAL